MWLPPRPFTPATAMRTRSLAPITAALEDWAKWGQARHSYFLRAEDLARAIAFGLCLEEQIEELTILGIDETERTKLAHDLRTKTQAKIVDGPLNPDTLRTALPEAQLLLQTTPIGMHPNIAATCVPKDLLHPHLTVMDIVYNPLNTQLLKDAQAAGCRTIQGVEMFLHQAVGQFELWTGQSAPVDVMRNVLTSHFQ